MSKVVTAPAQEVVPMTVPAEVSPVVEVVGEVIATPEPLVATAPAKKAVSKKIVVAKTAARKSVPAKSVTKPAAKTRRAAVKPAAQVKAAVAVKSAAVSADLSTLEKSAKESKAKKSVPKKAKLIRDSFTFPENDYALLTTLKLRALSAGQEIKKSELLRAGLSALAAMVDEDLLKVLNSVERIKTGRPAK